MTTEECSDKFNAMYHDPKLGTEGSVKNYSATARQYDVMLKEGEYTGPCEAAEAINNFYKTADKSKIKILDMACGTGLVAENLIARGFTNIDGVDASSGMLEVAKEKGLYHNTWCEFVGTGKQLPIEDNTYDALSIVGSMGTNQIPCAGVPEMVRLVKPGGVIANVFREEILEEPEYKNRLMPLMDQLESEGKWKKISVSRLEKYLVDKVALLCVYQVL